jgi:hypothetical protein
MMTPIVWWMLTALAMVDAGPIVQAYLCPYTALGRYFLATQLSVVYHLESILTINSMSMHHHS